MPEKKTKKTKECKGGVGKESVSREGTSKESANKKGVNEAVKEDVKKEDLGKEVGKVTHYFTNLGVAVIELSGSLKAGDKIRIKGATSDFKQKVDSMQIEHKAIKEAKSGQDIGMKVKEHSREGDIVYKL